MESVSHTLFRRGKRGTYYLRRRIPTQLRDAYPPGRQEIICSLRTSDHALALERLHAQMAKVDQEFNRRRGQLERRWTSSAQSAQHVTYLSDQQVKDLADRYVHCVLESDDQARRGGLDEQEFEELGSQIEQQHKELAALLARGNSEPILPAMRSFFRLCNINAQLAPDDEKRAAYSFLQAVVKALEHQALRQAGKGVTTAEVAPAPVLPKTWKEVFDTWRDYVEGRPKTTTIACNTAWGQLERFARSKDALWPAHVTPELMTQLIDQMRADKLAPKTINERLRKIRAVYKIAIGKQVLQINPATTTLGVKVPKHQQGRNKRLPFSTNELQTIFGSSIYTQHLRSQGQSGEATYWIPLIMRYSGARPEEIAGLAVDDIRESTQFGWYFHITDLPSADDAGLFDQDEPGDPVEVDDSEGDDDEERRHLKNVASRRDVPIARELIALGLLRYLEHIKAQGETRLFPTLRQDTHGKLSGAHGKFFGRYKRELGIVSNQKTLYSLRHNVKDLLERAQVPARYIKRLLGHTSGDGAVTDGYGTGLPLELIAEYFAKVQFPALPALPWQPGIGYVKLKTRAPRAAAP
jgi:integrase